MSHAAERAADAGMNQALHAQRVQQWKRDAEHWLDDQAQGRLFTADDLVAAIGLPDAGPGRNNVVGAWINAQKRQRRIEFTGRLSTSRRVEGHGNLQRLWRVKEERVGGGVDRLEPDGASSSPSEGDESVARVGEEAVSSAGREQSELEPAAADLADAPPGGPPDVEARRSLLDELREAHPELFEEAA